MLATSGIMRRQSGPGQARSCIKRRLTISDGPDSPKIGASYPRRRSHMDTSFDEVALFAPLPAELKEGVPANGAANAAASTEENEPSLMDLTLAAIYSERDNSDKVELLDQLSYHWQAASDQQQESELISALLGKLAEEMQLASHHSHQASLLESQKQGLQSLNTTLQGAYSALSEEHLQAGLQNAQLEADCARLEREKKAVKKEAEKEQALADERDEVHRVEMAAAAAEKARLLADCCTWMKRAKTLEEIGWRCGAWEYAVREAARARPGPPPRIQWPEEEGIQVVPPTVTVEELNDQEATLDVVQPQPIIKPSLVSRLSKAATPSKSADASAGNPKPARWWKKSIKKAEVSTAETTDPGSSRPDAAKPKTLGRKAKSALRKLGRWLSKRSQ